MVVREEHRAAHGGVDRRGADAAREGVVPHRHRRLVVVQRLHEHHVVDGVDRPAAGRCPQTGAGEGDRQLAGCLEPEPEGLEPALGEGVEGLVALDRALDGADHGVVDADHAVVRWPDGVDLVGRDPAGQAAEDLDADDLLAALPAGADPAHGVAGEQGAAGAGDEQAEDARRALPAGGDVEHLVVVDRHVGPAAARRDADAVVAPVARLAPTRTGRPPESSAAARWKPAMVLPVTALARDPGRVATDIRIPTESSPPPRSLPTTVLSATVMPEATTIPCAPLTTWLAATRTDEASSSTPARRMPASCAASMRLSRRWEPWAHSTASSARTPAVAQPRTLPATTRSSSSSGSLRSARAWTPTGAVMSVSWIRVPTLRSCSAMPVPSPPGSPSTTRTRRASVAPTHPRSRMPAVGTGPRFGSIPSLPDETRRRSSTVVVAHPSMTSPSPGHTSNVPGPCPRRRTPAAPPSASGWSRG